MRSCIILILLWAFSALAVNGQLVAEADTTRMNGSVDKVTEERMNKGLVTNSLDALSGQAAGVHVSTGANRRAMLNSVRVRGTTSLTGGNDPLVIIDGVYSNLSTLSTIYPADLASFTILKNASETALYGSRGASGIIEVSTKKGKGGQFRISYDGNMGFESVFKNMKMLDRTGYIGLAQQLGLSYVDGGYDTNFPQAITRTGFVQNHHIAFNGGSEQSSYRASIGFVEHNRVVRVDKYDNFVAKLDINQRAFDDHLTIDLGVFGSSQSSHFIFDEQKLFYSAAAQNPTFPNGMNHSGGWDRNAQASQVNNPLALLREKDHEKGLNFNTHIKFGIGLHEDLQLNLFGAYAFNSAEQAQYLPTWVWAQGQAYRAEQKSENWLGNVSLNYGHTWGVHQLKVNALGEYQTNVARGFYTTVKGFTTNDLSYDNLGAGAFLPYGGTGSGYEKYSLASFMVNATYLLHDTYSVNVNTRSDGSSMFGQHNKWGYFPSISGSWALDKEAFMREVSWVSQLKLRTGYGMSGNLGGIQAYNSLSLLKPNGLVSWNGSPTVTQNLTYNPNPDLKWERRRTFNLGVDMGLWDNRVILSAEYYYSTTKDMLYLYDVSVPPFTYNKLLANLGKMSNSGVELSLGITPIAKPDMELNVNLNMSIPRNKLISLSGDYNGHQMSAPQITPIGGLYGAGFHGGYNNIVYQIIGQPLGVFYLPHCTGLTANGDGTYSYEIADLDGNGKINLEDGGDRYIAGQATPKVTLGSNISFRYKDFDVTLQINGGFGHKIYNGTSLSYMNVGSFPDYNILKEAPSKMINDQTATDYWLEKGDYLNFDYLTVGWNVPLKHKFIHSLRLACSVNNLGTITGYSGLNPMINSYVVNSTFGIDDKRSYPQYRSYTMAVSIQF